jgi:2-polyprenyl-3-methyl-5-hydroxy-6-metoxy-1,4-benzoquinol methylase
MSKKRAFNEEFIYDASAIQREALNVEPRFGAFLRSVVGENHLVLDVGCGTGRYTAFSKKGNSIVGSELVFSAAKNAKRRGLENIIVADSEDLFPFCDGAFDRAQCIEVIEHLLDPVTTLKEINRVMKADGELFISTPNAAWWAHRVLMLCGITSFGHSPAYPVEVNMHIRHFTMKTLRQFLERSGFTVIKTQGTYMGFPGALSEYAPKWLAGIFNLINKITGGFGFLAKSHVWLSLTSAGLVVHARKVREVVN